MNGAHRHVILTQSPQLTLGSILSVVHSVGLDKHSGMYGTESFRVCVLSHV